MPLFMALYHCFPEHHILLNRFIAWEYVFIPDFERFFNRPLTRVAGHASQTKNETLAVYLRLSIKESRLRPMRIRYS